MRAKSLLLLIMALGCGLVASIGITQVMATRNAGPSAPAADTKAIFVALQDVSMGEALTPQLLKLEPWPKDRVPPGALSKLDQVEGRRPKTKLYAGEPIMDNKLLSKGESTAGASVLIPNGYRVVPMRVDGESGGAAMILPGDRVDVLVHVKKGEDVHETATRTILQDVKVFAVDDVFTISSDDQKAISAKTISLLLTPDQAEKVSLAGEMGKIRLVMRNPEDKEQAAVEGVMASDLFEDSERANRQKDSTLMDLVAPAADPGKDFLSMLKTQQAVEAASPALPAAPVAPAAPTWTVRTIHGPDVAEVVLQLEEDASSSTEKQGGFSLWKLITGLRSGRAAAPAVSGTAEPTTGDEDHQSEAQEPETDTAPDKDSQQSAEEGKAS